MAKKYNGRIIMKEMTFKEEGTFQSLYAAEGWLTDNGYEYGSLSIPHKEIAVVIGSYKDCDIPQKWCNFMPSEKKIINGVMVSNDYREGEIKLYLF